MKIERKKIAKKIARYRVSVGIELKIKSKKYKFMSKQRISIPDDLGSLFNLS